MMGTDLIKRQLNGRPRFNRTLGEGLAYHQSAEHEPYIREVLFWQAESWPTGIKYLGCRRATPEEQLAENTRHKRRARVFDILPSDVYMMVHSFEYNGHPLKDRNMFMLTQGRGSMFRLKGSLFKASPVLADILFTVEHDMIYMPIMKSKLRFWRISVDYIANGTPMGVDVIHSPIHHLATKASRTNAIVTTLVHYLMCKHGLAGAIKHYTGAEVVVGNAEINKDTYPPEDWMVCESTGVAPKRKGRAMYSPTDVRIAVPMDAYSQTVASMIGGIFYVIDHEPDMVTVDAVEDVYLWRRLLPRFILKEIDSEKKAMDMMDAHFDSLDTYLDIITERKLKDAGVVATNVFDLLYHIIDSFRIRTLRAKPADMSDKYLETTRFLLFGIVCAITDIGFALKKLVKSKGDRLDHAAIDKLLGMKFPIDEIMDITSGHGEVTSVSSPSDSLLIGITKSIIPQSRTTQVRKSNSKSGEMNNPANALDKTQLIVSGASLITASNPSGRSSLNHFLQIERDGKVIIPDEFKEDLDKFGRMIEGD